MGTQIIDEPEQSVKRFYGGTEQGVCFDVRINRVYTQKEICELLVKIMENLIVSGEGKQHIGDGQDEL